MSTLAVLRFDDEGGAQRATADLERAGKQGLITIDDAAIVIRPIDGKVKVQQLHNLVGAGALGGAFWGMLIGLLFFMPWLGMGIGAVTGALSGKFTDIGIDDEFIKHVGEQIQPGNSALFLMVREATVDKLAEEMSGDKFEIIHTSLDKEREEALKEAFSAHPATSA
jgi:uncharacterized membrane protein